MLQDFWPLEYDHAQTPSNMSRCGLSKEKTSNVEWLIVHTGYYEDCHEYDSLTILSKVFYDRVWPVRMNGIRVEYVKCVSNLPDELLTSQNRLGLHVSEKHAGMALRGRRRVWGRNIADVMVLTEGFELSQKPAELRNTDKLTSQTIVAR